MPCCSAVLEGMGSVGVSAAPGRVDFGGGAVVGFSDMSRSRMTQIVAIGTASPATGDRARKIEPLLPGSSESLAVTT